MVQPVDAAGQMFGIDTDPAAVGVKKSKAGRLFSAILLSAGRHGCDCRTCGFAGELADIMLEENDGPFPSPAVDPADAQPPAAPPAPAPAEAPVATAAALPPSATGVNSETPGG